jgi:hypothetical protein
MLDLLIYRLEAPRIEPEPGRIAYMICGKSCLAGDIFGEFRSPKPLKAGDRHLHPGRGRLHDGQKELVQRRDRCRRSRSEGAGWPELDQRLHLPTTSHSPRSGVI